VQRDLVLFDLDGTLIDPIVGIAGGHRAVCAHFGLDPMTDADVVPYIGPPIEEVFAQRYAMGAAEVHEAVEVYRRYFRERGVVEFTLYSEIAELLSGMRRSGIEIAVATSKLTVFADEILERAGIREHFAFVGGSSADGSRARKADVVAYVLESLPELRANCLVGDRPEDVVGASANEIGSIGATWGYGIEADLLAAGATAIARVPSDVMAIVDAFSRPV
jgi:phosphoglycolate phosphatase